MKILVHVIEARNLPPTDHNGLSNPYVKLHLGKHRAKTKVVKKNLNPQWDEEFDFQVKTFKEELKVSVLDEDKCFDEYVGEVKVTLSQVFGAGNASLGAMWYHLQPKSKKLKNKDCGEICLQISLSQENSEEKPKLALSFPDDPTSNSDKSDEFKKGRQSMSSNGDMDSASDISNSSSLYDRVAYIFGGKNNEESLSSSSGDTDSMENIPGVSANFKVTPEHNGDAIPSATYDKLLKTLELKDQKGEMPEKLNGGVLLDQWYAVASGDLNSLLFAPTSNFWQSLAEIQGTTGLQPEAWILQNGGESLKRVVKYTNAATKLIKAATATEEQMYLKADGKSFAVLVSVSLPDVPFGKTFKTEILYCITPGPQLSTSVQSSRLVISWQLNFLQSTMLRGMIKSKARQGLNENFVQVAEFLSQNVKPIDPPEVSANFKVTQDQSGDAIPSVTYDELLKTIESKDQGGEMPENLKGGVLLDQWYAVASGDLNSLLFAPTSNFWQSLAEIQGTTGLQPEAWILQNGGESLKRVVKYTNAATKLIKAATATEEQMYLKADGKSLAVLVSVSLPDVPFGKTFKTEILYCITPGPQLSTSVQSSRLVISWRLNFLQSTMLRGMIESKARQGLKENFVQVADFLSQNVKPIDPPEVSANFKVTQDQSGDAIPSVTYDELLKTIESKDQGGEMPENLKGGILLDQSYAVAPGDLNSLLFSPTSTFWQSLAEIQGTTGFQPEAWIPQNSGESLKRIVKYTKAASKLVKAVTATEEQTYLKADGKNFAILVSVSIPDVPFSNNFRTEVLFCIMAGPELPSQELSSHLVISWQINFLQSTMMKGVIENGARQGLKESYVQFADFLSQNIKPVDLIETASSKDQILASLQTEQESDWKLAYWFFGNFTVISSVFAAFYVLVHILISNPSTIQGLEFSGLDMPDSIGEIVVCGVLVLQGQRMLGIVGRYLQARSQRGSDHGIKALGDGWLLTIALIEGTNLAAADSTGYSDPYVIFTCNGKTKTSSVKFQTLDPHWNEIFEFDAMEDPPSVLNIEAYDFDGPFDEATSLGHAEVNFVKSNLSDLADVWIPLQGKLAQPLQSKLQVRIFLNNTRGAAIVTDYLAKMEKEVGKKITMRSPQTNSAFQKLFGLQPEEFLISEFSCHLKRKMSTQGRLFLSPRIIGFHANLFGHRTTFYFLWEDIDDIQVIPPTLASMGSPSLLVFLRKGRGLDAKDGARALDPDGRLRYQFQSFSSFRVANRTIMALWKARSLSFEQKMQIVEESEERSLHSEERGSFLGIQDVKMFDVFSSLIEVDMNSLMELFGGGSFEGQVMEKVGCVDYSVTSWEAVKSEVYQRQINYQFDKNIYRYGGQVTSTQQKSLLSDKRGWLIEEVMTLQGVLLGDYFNLHIRYQIDDLSPKLKACNVQTSLGIAWLKSTRHEKRISKNVMYNSSSRLKEMFDLAENKLVTTK